MADASLLSILAGTDPTSPQLLSGYQGGQLANAALDPNFGHNEGPFGALAKLIAGIRGGNMEQGAVQANTAARMAAQPDLAKLLASPDAYGTLAASPDQYNPIARAQILAGATPTTAADVRLKGAQVAALQNQLQFRNQFGGLLGNLLGGGTGAPTGAAPGALGGAPAAGGGDAAAGPGKVSLADATAAALRAGFSPETAPIAAATGMAESGGNLNAANEKGEHSYGYMQVNADAHGPQAHDTLGNLDKSMQLAYQISHGGTDFSPWTMYRNGTYKQYLPGIAAANRNVGQSGPPAAPAGAGGSEASPAEGGMVNEQTDPALAAQINAAPASGAPIPLDGPAPAATGAQTQGDPSVSHQVTPNAYWDAQARVLKPGILPPAAASQTGLAALANAGQPAIAAQRPAGGALPLDPRKIALLGALGTLGGMGDVAKPLAEYVYNSPQYIEQKAAAEGRGKLPFTPQNFREGSLGGFYDAQGQMRPSVYNPKLPVGQMPQYGPNGEVSAVNVPGAIPGVAAAASAQAGGAEAGKAAVKFGDLLNPQAAAGAQPETASKPTPTPRGTLLPPVSEQGPIPQNPAQLEHALPAWQKLTNEWADSIGPAQQSEMRLDTIAKAFKMTESGAFTEQKADLAAALKAIGLPSALVNTDPAQVQLALHENYLQTLTRLKAATSRFTQQEFRITSEKSEHPNLQPEANLQMLSEDIATLRQAQQLPADWIAAQGQGWKNPQAFQSAWQTQNPLEKAATQVKQEIGPLKGMPGAGGAIPDGAIAVGPNGHKIVRSNGQWLDAVTKRPFAAPAPAAQ